MACILKPQCNFLHWYFMCLLPLETVDVEVKVKMMRGIHTLQRDRTTQVILGDPWSTGLCPYSSLIRKIKTCLELEGKLGLKPKPIIQPQSQPCTSTPSHNGSLTRKTLMLKKAEKKSRARTPVKRRYKVRVVTQPLPTTPTLPVNPISPVVPTPTVATSTTTTQTPMMKSAATSIPVIVYNLAQGNLNEFPTPQEDLKWKKILLLPAAMHPSQRQQAEAIHNAPTFQVREDTPWPNNVPASTNLFEARTDWPIPPMQTPTVKIEKAEIPPREAAIPMLWFCPNHRTISQWKKNVHGDHTAPFAKRKKKKAQKIGMVTDRKASRGTTTLKKALTPTNP